MPLKPYKYRRATGKNYSGSELWVAFTYSDVRNGMQGATAFAGNLNPRVAGDKLSPGVVFIYLLPTYTWVMLQNSLPSGWRS